MLFAGIHLSAASSPSVGPDYEITFISDLRKYLMTNFTARKYGMLDLLQELDMKA